MTARANSARRPHAIVTGAASGLGRAIALRLARDGWHIAVCDINQAGADETARLVQQAGGEAQVELLDVTQIDQWQALRAKLMASWDHLDLLVNNAGVAGAGDVGHYPLEDWHWILNINLWNGIYGCHTFVEWLKANPHGAHIINTASLAAIGSAPGMGGYNVSKAGMLALSETLYAELLPHNVTVTVLCPAFFATNLLAEGRFAVDDLKRLAEKAFERSKMTAAEVADHAVRAMHRGQLYVVLPASGRMSWYLKRLAPQWFMKRVSRLLRKQAGAGSKSAAAVEPR